MSVNINICSEHKISPSSSYKVIYLSTYRII